PAPVAVAQAAGATPDPSAGEAIGVVTKIDGEVFVVRGDGTRVVLQSGSQVFKGDVLQTGADGAVGITFVDNTELSLGNGGRLVLDEMIFDPDSGQGQSSFSLVSGVFSFVSGQIAKTGPDAMQVQTPVATIGIRGTKGVIKVAEGDDVLDGDRPVSMEIALLDSGEIVVRTLNGQMQTLNTVNTGLQVSNQAAADALFGGGQTLRLFTVDADYVASNPDVGRTLNFLPSAQPGQYDTPEGFNLGAVDGPVEGPQNNQPQGGPQQQQTDFDTLGRLDNPFSDGNSTIRVSLDAGQLREILGARLDVGEKDLANVVSVLELMAPVRTDSVVVATLTTPTTGDTSTTPSTTTPTTTDPVTPTTPTVDTPTTGTGGDTGTPVPPPVVVAPTPTTPTTPPVVTPDPTPVGGGSGGSGGGSTITVAGRVVDPYVFNARVFIDEDADGVWDPTEAYTYTDAEGRYSLSTTGTSGRIVSEGGIDVLTGNALNFTMSAPVGASAVTPLTTLMQALMSSNPSLTPAAAQSQVLGMVGLTTADIGGLDLTTANPLALLSGATAEAGAKLLAAGIKVANVISMVAAIRGDGDPAAASTAIASAVVASGGASDLFDTGLTTLLGNAGVASGDVASVATVLTNLNTAVDTALSSAAGDPAAALTGVVQVAIVAQGEAASTVASVIASGGDLAGTVSSFVSDLSTKIADASPFVTLTGTTVSGSDPASSYILIGTEGNDSLTGNARADRLFGDEGNDLLTGAAGNDQLDAGAGDDTLVGGEGGDSLLGGAGNDVLRPFGTDTSVGALDSVDGGEGLDTLDLSAYGTAVEIRLSTYDSDSGQLVGEVSQFSTNIASLSNIEAAVGTIGNDTLVGLGADEDLVDDLPTAVDDTLDGGAGSDLYHLTSGNDEIVRGTGDDTIAATIAFDLKANGEEQYVPTAIGIEIQGASRSDDDLLLATYSHDRGTAYTVTVSGAFAADPADYLTIITSWGEVTESYSLLTYGLSDSTIYLTSNSDEGQLVVGRSGDDLILEGGEGSGGDGDDLIYADAGDDEVHAGLGDDVIYGGTGNDILIGGTGGDTVSSDFDSLYGGEGDDVLWYDANDVLDGGDGFDLLEVNDGGDGVFAADIASYFGTAITDMEGLLLDSSGAVTLTLEAADVAAMATDGVLYIRGGSDDTIEGTEGWSLASDTTTVGGVTYRTLTQTHQGETLTLRVEDGIDVTALTGEDDRTLGGTADSLAAQLLGGLSGITVTGATLQGNTTSGQQSYGSFSSLTMGGAHSLSAGIALASGINPLDNANTVGSTGTLASGQGNDLLDGIPNIGNTTDATVLTVTFTVDSGIDGLSFGWMFGTEEAPEQSVTDVAGVFLNDTNLLFMPDGETPVAWYNGNTTQMAAYTLNSGQLATEYDSVISPQDLYVPLTAGTHTLTIAVSDTSDTGFDSALFIAFKELVATSSLNSLLAAEDEGGQEPTVGTDGDDTFDVSSIDFPGIDGGAGLDTLYINGDLDFTQLDEGQVASIERLVLDEGSDAITLDAAAVAQLLSESDSTELTIEVQNATPDDVTLSEDFVAVDGEAPEGYTSYSNGSHTVTIVDHNAPSQPLAA
ncbi:MAG: choice-of-anchor L domain-containing protein, partial [Caenispirillum bisanense]|nr:choice-of-anchor L domain-containing protein [Caenispirillum bisanense]MCA1971652.1 choice-of-anchor L domain-containing protein [Caenispirillum sp.]